MPLVFRTSALALICLLSLAIPRVHAAGEEALWDALRTPGHIAFIRHALAPGNGDPDNFTLGDCSTQRNLSEGGRRQARRTGDAFRANGIASAKVYSSQWCRCTETAELMKLGEVAPLPALNSIYRRSDRREPQLKALRQEIASMELKGPVIMSTHHSIIVALVGASPRSGEIVVVKRTNGDELSLMGKIAPSATE
jgi:hypothetical protein